MDLFKTAGQLKSLLDDSAQAQPASAFGPQFTIIEVRQERVRAEAWRDAAPPIGFGLGILLVLLFL